MSIKSYWLSFGSGNPQLNAGLTPTFITFQAATALTLSSGFTSLVGFTALTSPPIYEIGVSVGLYSFCYDQLANPFGITSPIVFTVDGGAALLSANRYISAVLDPIQAVDQRLGYVTDSYGSTLLDPASALGYLRRALEFWEGAAVYTKPTGIWQIYDRGNTLLLRQHQLTNSSATTTKT